MGYPNMKGHGPSLRFVSEAHFLLGCPRKIVNDLQMGYNLLINGTSK